MGWEMVLLGVLSSAAVVVAAGSGLSLELMGMAMHQLFALVVGQIVWRRRRQDWHLDWSVWGWRDGLMASALCHGSPWLCTFSFLPLCL